MNALTRQNIPLFDQLPFYSFDVPVEDRRGRGVSKVVQDIVLPHEALAALYDHHRSRFHEIMATDMLCENSGIVSVNLDYRHCPAGPRIVHHTPSHSESSATTRPYATLSIAMSSCFVRVQPSVRLLGSAGCLYVSLRCNSRTPRLSERCTRSSSGRCVPLLMVFGPCAILGAMSGQSDLGASRTRCPTIAASPAHGPACFMTPVVTGSGLDTRFACLGIIMRSAFARNATPQRTVLAPSWT